MAEASRVIKLEILGDAKGAQTALAELSSDTEKHSGLIKNSLSTAFGVFSGEKLKEGFSKGVDFLKESMDTGVKSVGEFQAKLGLTASEAQKLTSVSTAVWKDGWGEDLNAVNAALITTKQQFSNLNDADLQNLTEQGLILQQTFDADITESMRTASTMAKNFGISGSDAMDLVTKSFQLGGNKADDLLDTFNEYSVQFKGMGYDAKEFSNILVNGLDNGAFNADKVADAVKEFNIRLKDGSETTRDSIQMLGIDSVKLFDGLMDGSISGKDAMKIVNDALRDVKDPIEQNILATGLYGTQWEDMGGKVILSLDQASDKLGDFKGATQAAGSAVSQDFGSMWTSFSRGLQAQLAPILATLIALFMQWVPTIQQVLGQVGTVIQQVFTAAMPYVQQFFGWLSTNGPPILSGIGDVFNNLIIPAALGLAAVFVNDVLPAVQSLWGTFVNDLLPVLIQIGQWFVADILPTLGEFVGFVIGQVLPAVVSLIAQFLNFLIPVLSQVGEFISTVLVPAFQTIVNYFITTVIPGFQQLIDSIQTSVMPVLSTIATFITTVLVTAWNVLSTVVSTVWTAISGFISSNWGTIQGILNIITGVVGGAFSTIWNTLSTLIGGVWTAISTAISTAWNTIQGIFNIISSVLSGDFGGAWNAFLGLVGNVWSGVVTQIQNAWNTISGIFGGIIGFLVDIFGAAWTALQLLLETVWTAIYTAINDAWVLVRDIFNNIKEFIETVVVGAFTGLQTSIGSVWTNINSGISSFFEGAKNIFNDLIKFVGEIPSKILSALGDLGSTLFNAGKSLIQGLINGIGSIHIPLPHISVTFHDTQVGPLTIPVPDFSVGWYAKGGIFDAASIIGVGEAGPEAVLPIDKLTPLLSDSLRELGLGGGNTSGSSEQSMRQMIREELADLIQRSSPVIYQTIYGVQAEDVTRETTKALRRQALDMGLA